MVLNTQPFEFYWQPDNEVVQKTAPKPTQPQAPQFQPDMEIVDHFLNNINLASKYFNDFN